MTTTERADTRKCDACGRERVILHSNTWSRERGQIVGANERICTPCLRKRGGKTLHDIDREIGERERAK